MTLKTAHIASAQVGWQARSLALLANVNNLDVARISEAAHVSAETVEVPRWPASRIGTVAYFAVAVAFLLLTIALKPAPGPGSIVIAPVYLLLVTLVACVSLPRRAN